MVVSPGQANPAAKQRLRGISTKGLLDHGAKPHHLSSSADPVWLTNLAMLVELFVQMCWPKNKVVGVRNLTQWRPVQQPPFPHLGSKSRAKPSCESQRSAWSESCEPASAQPLDNAWPRACFTSLLPTALCQDLERPLEQPAQCLLASVLKGLLHGLPANRQRPSDTCIVSVPRVPNSDTRCSRALTHSSLTHQGPLATVQLLQRDLDSLTSNSVTR